MNFHFRQDYPDQIEHDDSDESVGYIIPLKRGSGFSLHRALTPSLRDKIAVIKSLEEAIPTLIAYYERHPPPWRKRARRTEYNQFCGYMTFTEYVKSTFYGLLTVESYERGRWLVYRRTDPLMDEVGILPFATSEEAMRAAELHMGDGFPNAKPSNDGLSFC